MLGNNSTLGCRHSVNACTT